MGRSAPNKVSAVLLHVPHVPFCIQPPYNVNVDQLNYVDRTGILRVILSHSALEEKVLSGRR
jgi:hypothetical protein